MTSWTFSTGWKSLCSWAPHWFSWCVGTSWLEVWAWDVVCYVCYCGVSWYVYMQWILPWIERFVFPQPPRLLYPDPPDLLILGSGPLNRHPTRPGRPPTPSPPRLEAMRRRLGRLIPPHSHSTPPPAPPPSPRARSTTQPLKTSSPGCTTTAMTPAITPPHPRTGTPTPFRAPSPIAATVVLPSHLPRWLQRMLAWRWFPPPKPGASLPLHWKRRGVARTVFRLVTYVAVPVVLAVCIPFGAGIALTPAIQACLQQLRLWSRLLLSWHNILAH